MKPQKTAYQRRKERATCLVYRAIVAMIQHEEVDDYLGKYAYSDESVEMARGILESTVKQFQRLAKREDEN